MCVKWRATGSSRVLIDREGKPFQSQENGKKRGPFATEGLVVLQFVQLIRYQKTHKVCEDG